MEDDSCVSVTELLDPFGKTDVVELLLFNALLHRTVKVNTGLVLVGNIHSPDRAVGNASCAAGQRDGCDRNTESSHHASIGK
jgi:hypothetical protein